MDYCTYHPLEAATYHCPHCQIDCCDHCVDDSNPDNGFHCLKCQGELVTLSAEHRVPPFWRRLQESFRYPLNVQTLTLIGVVSVIGTLTSVTASALLFAFIINLAATGVMLKYCFLCLQATSSGKLVAPDLSEAYQGGITLVLRLIIMVALMIGAVIFVAMSINPSLGYMLGLFFMVAFPASLIQFAISEEMLSALNPVNTFRLIVTIGLPYGLLIGLILVMVGSVSVIHQLIGYEFSIIALSLQSMVSNYYMVVVFHIMGYMIFQYQGRLGYTAREHYGDEEFGRSQEAVAMARLDILLKEGRYDALIEGYDKALAQFPASKALHSRYFDFLTQARNPEWLKGFAERYLRFLLQQGHMDHLSAAYGQIRAQLKQFIPENPNLRLALARACHRKDDARAVIALINGMQKQCPDYPQLPAALELMAQALDQLPNMAAKAEQCRRLAARVSAQQAKAAAEPTPSAPKPRPLAPAPAAAKPVDTERDGIGPPRTLDPIDFE